MPEILTRPAPVASPWALFEADLRRWGPAWSAALDYLRALPVGQEITLRDVRRLVPKDEDGQPESARLLAAAASRGVLERLGRRRFPFRDLYRETHKPRVRKFTLAVFRKVA